MTGRSTTEDALANALVKHENDDPEADALASGFVFGMC